MGLSRVTTFLVLVAVVRASVNNNGIEGEERVVLVAPVLAPPRDSRTHVTDRARQFPILVLLSQQNAAKEPEAKSLNVNPEPIYVQKLEDQTKAVEAPVAREKRTLKHLFGGGGGCYGGCGGGGGGGGGPPLTVVIVNKEGRHRGGGRGYGHHYPPPPPPPPYYGGGHEHGNGCGGGCGGNYGNGGYSSSRSYSYAESNSYGKR